MQITPLAHGHALGHPLQGGPLVRPAGHPEQWHVATALRNLAIAHTDAPRYLLAHEVGAVLAMLPDLQRRFLVATLWNSGARINEALALPAPSGGNRQTLGAAAGSGLCPAGPRVPEHV